MVYLDQWNRGVVVRPSSGSMVIEVIREARQVWRGYVGGGDPGKIGDPVCWNDVPYELRSRRTADTARWVVDGNLGSVCGGELAEVAGQHSLRWNRSQQPSIPKAREIQAQASEEEGLVVAVINMRNHQRPTEGKPAFVVTDGLLLLRKERSRVQLVIL